MISGAGLLAARWWSGVDNNNNPRTVIVVKIRLGLNYMYICVCMCVTVGFIYMLFKELWFYHDNKSFLQLFTCFILFSPQVYL